MTLVCNDAGITGNSTNRSLSNIRQAYSASARNYRLPAQPVDATQVLNLSAGVSNAKVFRGRSFS